MSITAFEMLFHHCNGLCSLAGVVSILCTHLCLILLFLLVLTDGLLLLQVVSHFLPSSWILRCFPWVSFWPRLTCGMACLEQLWSLLISRIFKKAANSFLLSVVVSWFSFLYNGIAPFSSFVFVGWFSPGSLGFLVCDFCHEGSQLKNERKKESHLSWILYQEICSFLRAVCERHWLANPQMTFTTSRFSSSCSFLFILVWNA